MSSGKIPGGEFVIWIVSKIGTYDGILLGAIFGLIVVKLKDTC